MSQCSLERSRQFSWLVSARKMVEIFNDVVSASL